jgi:outer membrane protein, heavy metal efflux system
MNFHFSISQPRILASGSGLFALLLLGFLTGCRGLPLQREKQARQQLHTVTATYRPQGSKPTLPALTTNSTLQDFLTYALLNDPKVEAAYYDWAASVERITTARSLPDPQFTFQMDIQEVVTSLMPGLMMSFPGKGKLRAAGEIAAAESDARYYAFKAVSLSAAYSVKRAYYQLYFLEEKIRVNRETLGLLSDLEKIARAQNEVGRVTLQDVLRAQIEQDKVATELANLADSREVLLARFKASLGIGHSEPTPALPARFESTPMDWSAEELTEQALAQNTRLKAVRAEVRAAEAAISLAYKARMPDTSVGFMADAKMSPVLYRPWGTVSLPIWRDKLVAQVAEAQANKRAGEARLSAEEIALTVDVAERTFIYREASRNLKLLEDHLLPKQRQSLEVARSGYLAGQIDFFNLTDAEQTLLRFGLDQVEAKTQRELSLAELSLIAQGLSPDGGTSGLSMRSGIANMPAQPAGGVMGSAAPTMLPSNTARPMKSGSGRMK